VINAVTGKPDYIPLATHAYNLGHIAGENAAGGNVKYEQVVQNISVKIFDKFFASVGLSSDEAERNNFDFEGVFAKQKLSCSNARKRFCFVKRQKSNRIVGASFLGGKEISGYADLLSALIKLKVPASTLSHIDYNYTPPLSPFINLLNIIGKKFSDIK
jgi:pyruvate/2-oxoglutarate dehydrogenase complex dihydrolipoamide dehydrogenase (E3) component